MPTKTMTQSREPSDFSRDMERRFGHLNRRLERLEDTQISPQEFVRALDRLSEDTSAIRAEIAELRAEINSRFESLESKFDIVMQHITGGKS